METKGLKNLRLGLPLIFLSVGLGIFIYIKLSVHRYYYDEYVDQRLRSAANATEMIVPDSLIDAASNQQNIDILYYDSIQRFANEIARDNNVVYVYVLIERNDSAFFVISSFIEEDISNDIVTRYMDVYEDATEKMMASFGAREEEIFDVTIDIWGHFRSIYLPRQTEAGTEYLIGADIRSSEIVRQQWNYLIELLVSGVFLVLIFLPLFLRVRKIIIECRNEKTME